MSAGIVQPMILQHQLITSQLVIELCAFSNRYPSFYIKISKITAQVLRNQNMQKFLIHQPKWCKQLSSYETLVTQSTSMWCQHPKEGSTLSFHGNYLSESVMFILIRKLWLDCFAMTYSWHPTLHCFLHSTTECLLLCLLHRHKVCKPLEKFIVAQWSRNFPPCMKHARFIIMFTRTSYWTIICIW
jgi:hypothetical protein